MAMYACTIVSWVCCLQTTPLTRKMVRWTKSNFLVLLPECGKDHWDCTIVNYYIAHSQATMCKDTRLFSSFSFSLDKETLNVCCGDNFWSDFLHSIVLVVKVFQRQETQLSPHRNMQQEQRLLRICWTAWIVLPWVLQCMLSMVLQPFSSFAEHGLHTYTLPPPQLALVDSQKKGKHADSLGGEGFKSLLWVPVGRGEQHIVHSTSSLLKWAVVIVLVLDTEALRLIHR